MGWIGVERMIVHYKTNIHGGWGLKQKLIMTQVKKNTGNLQ